MRLRGGGLGRFWRGRIGIRCMRMRIGRNRRRNADGLAQVGTRFGMSEAAMKMSLSRLRKRDAQSLRDEVAETLGSGDSVQDELRYLLALFT
jgi:hypothetical protein